MRTVCSFSGGKTSAYMAIKMKESQQNGDELLFVFANTGQENEQTLRFVEAVDSRWGLGVVWVEAAVHPEAGVGTTHKIVDFSTACRDASLFDAMCSKYGIPNSPAPHCTRELKLRPIESYIRSLGWTDHKTAIGIRTDEDRRAGNDPKIIYPLIDIWPTDKQDINDFWSEQPFTLNLTEHQGNCKWCWKKSLSKLVRIAKESREFFDAPAALEAKHGTSGPKFRKDPSAPREVFFRGRRSTMDILALADISSPLPAADVDSDGGCSESCEFALT